MDNLEPNEYRQDAAELEAREMAEMLHLMAETAEAEYWDTFYPRRAA